MPSVPTRGGDVAYRVKGKGQPIVLLHATLHDSRDYEVIADRLAEKYRTISVDWPWHGDSKGTPSKERLSAVGFADVLEDVVEGLKLEPAIFIGNSVGGFAAARLAITQPDKVRGLVLVNAGGFVTWTPFTRLVARLLGFASISRLVMPHLVGRYMSPQTSHDEDITRRVTTRARTEEGASVVAALWRSFLDPRHDLRSRAESIKAPVLLVWGTRDPVFSRTAAEETKLCIAGAKLEFLDAGHVVFSSMPTEFQRLVQLFIESIVEE
ncbi:uncharacterized protein A1O5_11093 [Cladophialophora psammophila CBS 110553]|uniref:AB hydrolase-1 domain-containing protein n=1 Tax=Cladophialophora psammophila CBS 110553 TaxID=1182543 RepID=W9WCP7_9EURO|nr:uncharacterized protein A1O5_11093 [Cladophialophora psammophila CBS 110553]EXJ65852.1 hypothetical protein A1O5_11093 [Cladophialophora psammophila CBS 110553]